MGAALCLVSAAAFGVMAVFGKLAFGQGVDLDSLLLARFTIAAAVLVPVALRRGAGRRLTVRQVVAGLLMGAVGYALQATLYFSALTHASAGEVGLLFACYPLLVMVGAVLTGREATTRRRWVALGVSWAGIALVVSAASVGSLHASGAAYALGAAAVYCIYILVGDRVTERLQPLDVTALVVSGAAATFLVTGLVKGGPHLDVGPRAWLWLVLTGLVSTVGAILMFFAGMARVGPSLASLLGALEPVVTVVSAGVVFGEWLTPLQVLGAALVVSAIVIVQEPRALVPEVGVVPPASS